jgi:hypothetical protein
MYLMFSFGVPITGIILFSLPFWPVIIIWFGFLVIITIIAIFTS